MAITKYVAVDDCGPQINPLLVEGQVQGGIAHSIGQVLFEQTVYDENGQLLTGEFMDYAMPRAADIPDYVLGHTVTPSPVNPLGVKGVGEAGTIGATPAIANAVLDALAPLGVTHLDLPMTPGAGSGRREYRIGRDGTRTGWDSHAVTVGSAGTRESHMYPASFDYNRPRASTKRSRCSRSTATMRRCWPADTA